MPWGLENGAPRNQDALFLMLVLHMVHSHVPALFPCPDLAKREKGKGHGKRARDGEK